MFHLLTPLAIQIQDVTSTAPLMGHNMSHPQTPWATDTRDVPSLHVVCHPDPRCPCSSPFWNNQNQDILSPHSLGY